MIYVLGCSMYLQIHIYIYGSRVVSGVLKTVFSRHCLLDMVSCAITSGNRQATYLKEFLVDVLVEELVGFLGRPSPGNPMTSTFPRPPLFTFAGEVADDPKLVAALKVIFSEHLDSKG
jgi:hypothetical protein